MDPQEVVAEAIIRVLEVELAVETDKTRLMAESLRADLAALEAKERERSMLMREKDRILATKEAEEKLVASFLEADGNKNYDDQKAMLDDFVALMSREGVDGSNAGEFAGFYGGNIENLENSQNLEDEGAPVATIEGTNGGEE